MPLLIYVILVFRDVEILPATAVCVVIGALLSGQTLSSFGAALANSMGSFLALVGLIIMLGRGLGEVLNATGVSHTIVHRIIHSIGVDTEKKAMLGIMAACLVMVGLLGTMAGGNAVIAPIVLPVAAAVGPVPDHDLVDRIVRAQVHDPSRGGLVARVRSRAGAPVAAGVAVDRARRDAAGTRSRGRLRYVRCAAF